MTESLPSDEPPFIVFPPFEVFYLTSLEFCTLSALESAGRVAEWVQQKQFEIESFPPQLPLNELQNIINQGAAISRFFWPSDKKYKARGNALKSAFRIDESNPLKDLKLRNMVEHFDEYLDDYLACIIASVKVRSSLQAGKIMVRKQLGMIYQDLLPCRQP